MTLIPVSDSNCFLTSSERLNESWVTTVRLSERVSSALALSDADSDALADPL
ncbi:hypothetical protein BN11_1220005 [Nostocoides australiense Ben110]|uniref:Uncharacterized protein n=1 Tax=Nostocoides australiense Ben110 TaxID=1193182 RepID=W6JTZ8_9MICO|nr:hypothetical protein BN11_1220005 [Tetrasphaera australiensis Ben110]